MTVEVYKPVLKSKLVQPVQTNIVAASQPVSRTSTDNSDRKIRHVYTPIKPRMELVIGIEEMTHPDGPSFAELEALIIAEGLA